ncbi:LPS-assembly protein LptD [Methylocella tundrae]|uniref:LPS-assembly protein LptD n=1 Tax=Methylocella tundrae TaxID=227605 RepID=A0A4V6IN24_METTU|nr:LPS-assembly protein LptD [Methylocella tundrae]VFU10732.1 LPS-assembly protein LptD [Methylocella tundrae]
MGRRFCPNGARACVSGLRGLFGPVRGRIFHAPASAPPQRSSARAWLAALLCLALLCLAAVSAPAAIAATERPPQPPAGQPPDKMFVEANELRYDTVKNTVAAVGDARVYYKGRVLEADRVTYDRKTGRVLAEGHAKLTETDGSILHGDQFDLTDDFRDGFIESLRADTSDKTFFSAPHAERIEGDTTVFNKGTYTACAACTGSPDKPPLWRVRAKRIVHKNDEQMIYYEDASLEFLGVPLAYVPFFSAPDPTVTRKSGILSPHLIDRSTLGYGVGIPIFWALAPDYDLTFTPTALSKQGFLASGEWRQRFDIGQYYIRANGISQMNPSFFPTSPWGSGNQTLRGSFESAGELAIADQWKFGWAFTLLSDKWFLNDYNVPSQTLSSNYIAETTSTVYLTGQSNRGYFDLRGYYFEGLSTHDFQPQQPLAHPVWDYNKTIDIDPANSWGIGGEVEADFNLTSLSAAAASYQSVGTQVLDNAYQMYNVCTNYVPGTVAGKCLLRGVGGEYTRTTVDISWKRKLIDPIGEVWTPFAFAHVNGEWLDLNTTNSYTFSSSFGSSTFSNSSQLNFLGNRDVSFYGAFVPGVGLEYRYPFFAKLGFGSVTVEPIAQIIMRPNNPIGAFSNVNLDAQSLVFDESTLFDWNKYSGYDRFETGMRANYGGQFTLNFKDGGYINVIGGQSYQVAGTNSYATADAANVGLSSGLDTRASDYVGALSIAPNSAFSFTAKSRFDVNTFEPRRIDLVGNYNLGAWTGGIQYANYQAQPVIGYYVRREGLSLNSRYKISDNYFAQGNITFDMSRQFYPAALIGYTSPGPFAIAAFGMGAGYNDDCTTFSVNYSSIYQDNGNGALIRNQTVLLQLQLRTLGGTKLSESFNNTAALDGVKY